MVMGREGKFWANAAPQNANTAIKATKIDLRITPTLQTPQRITSS
jgi:hypothetical protein